MPESEHPYLAQMTAPAAAVVLASAVATPARGVHRNLSYKELQHSASGGSAIFASKGKSAFPDRVKTAPKDKSFSLRGALPGSKKQLFEQLVTLYAGPARIGAKRPSKRTIENIAQQEHDQLQRQIDEMLALRGSKTVEQALHLGASTIVSGYDAGPGNDYMLDSSVESGTKKRRVIGNAAHSDKFVTHPTHGVVSLKRAYGHKSGVPYLQ